MGIQARLFGNFFELTNHLKELLSAKDCCELYGKVLARMGEDFGLPQALPRVIGLQIVAPPTIICMENLMHFLKMFMENTNYFSSKM